MVPRFMVSLFLALLLGGCATSISREPHNLGALKGEIDRYVDSGAYQQDIAAAAAPAQAWIVSRATAKKPGERLALILDIDETMLSNLPLIRRDDYGYLPDQWNAWVAEGKCPAIEPVRAAYQAAVDRGVSVFIITGRRERDRAGTVANLKAAGYAIYAGLYLKDDNSHETTGAFKLAWRRKLAAEGYTLIANIGDQDSDFAGGGAEKDFKLPDPFYLTQ